LYQISIAKLERKWRKN